MSHSLQRNLPPMPLPSVERRSEGPLHKVETGDLPLEAAKQLAGAIVADVLHDTRAVAKEYGDRSAVGRWTRGEENPNLARLIQTAAARKAMAKALLKSLPDVEHTETFKFKGETQ
jgi:hypothetical protein